MKIAVYNLERVTPKNDGELEEILDIFNLPSLRFGYAEFIGKFSHWMTKSELNKMQKVYHKGYDKYSEVWREGFKINLTGTPLFAQYVY